MIVAVIFGYQLIMEKAVGTLFGAGAATIVLDLEH